MVAGSELQIIGQRGAAGHAPENTSAAIQKAIDLGASAVALDIQYARDGEPVVFREATLEATAGVRGSIRDQSLRELSGYDIGFKRGPDFRGLRLLTLDEAATLIPPEVQLHLEIIECDPVNPRHLRETLAVLKRRGGILRCILSSENFKILTSLRTLDRKCRRGLRTSGKTTGRPSQAAKLGCEAIYAEGKHADAALAEECKAAGVGLIAYDVNDRPLIKRLAGLGVAGISSGYPDRLLEVTRVAPARTKSARARPAPRRQSHSRATPPPGASPSRAQSETVSAAPAPRRQSHSRAAPPPGASLSTAQTEATSVASAAAIEPAAPALDPDPAATKKRRRGRRGGKRVRARRERQVAAPSQAEPVKETATPEASSDKPSADAGTLSPDSKSARPKQRRGRRGGRRHRPRRAKPAQSGNGQETGPKA